MKDLKKWFEANFLDGDAIQRGQMISSDECFRIACLAFKDGEARGIERSAEFADEFGGTFNETIQGGKIANAIRNLKAGEK